MNNQMMWLFVVIALIFGALGGYAYEKSNLTSKMMMMQSTLQKQLDDTKMANDKLTKEQQMGGNNKMQPSPEPSGKMMQQNITKPSGAMMEK